MTTPPTATPISVTATTADRVDKELTRHFPAAGRKQIAELFDAGAIKVAGKRAKKGDRVAPGDIIQLTRTPVAGEAFRPEPDAETGALLHVLLERPEVIVVLKPAGLPSQPLKAGERGTAANGIAARWPECATIGDDARDGGLVHRLDIGTSGALIAARTPAVYRALREAFGSGLVEKVYLAITEDRPVSRECDAPLVHRGKRVVVDHTDGLAAHTTFDVERSSATHALVRCTARTGRMHQIRAHLAHVGSPIAGDTLYGANAVAEHDGFYLHAASIAFPLAGERVQVDVPAPARFAAALAACGL